MAENTTFSLAFLILAGVAALVVLAGGFALFYWLMSRGRDEDQLT